VLEKASPRCGWRGGVMGAPNAVILMPHLLKCSLTTSATRSLYQPTHSSFPDESKCRHKDSSYFQVVDVDDVSSKD